MLTKEEKAILDEWEKARRSWWLYTPAQLRKLEKEATKIYEKEENKMKKKKFYLTIECYEYQNGQRVGTKKCYATTSSLYNVTDNIKRAKKFTEYMANKLLSNPLNKGWEKEEIIEGDK